MNNDQQTFELFCAWIHTRASACMTEDEIEALLAFQHDDDLGYEFDDQTVNAQWEAWVGATEATLTEVHLSEGLEA